MAAILRDGDGRGRVGSVHLVPRRRPVGPTGAVARWPTTPSSTRCSTCCGTAGRGVVEVVPGLLGTSDDPYTAARTSARRCGARGIPLTWTGVHLQPSGNPAARSAGSTWPPSSARRASRSYPQLSPRTVDMRLNWDSSMMFMSMPDGWHKVIAAQGDDKAALLAGPGVAGHGPRRVGPDRAGDVPHQPPRSVRFVEVVGAENEQWLGRTFADAGRRARRPPVRRARRLRARPTTAGPASSPRASPTPTSRAWPARSPIPAVLISSSDAGAHVADAVRVGRHARCCSPATSASAATSRSSRRSTSSPAARPRCSASTAGARSHRAAIADLVVFALDELHYERRRVRATTCPAAGRGCAAPRAATGPRSSTAPRCSSTASSPGTCPVG